MSTNVLITGGAGFIGSHLVDALLERRHNVRVLDNLSPQVHGEDYRLPSYFPDEAEFVLGDVQDRSVVCFALRDVDIVFHLAAETGVGQSMYESGNYTRSNVTGVATLWDAIHTVRGTTKVILASSRAVYGEGAYYCANCGRVRPELRRKESLEEGQWNPLCPRCGSTIQSVATNEQDSPSPTSVYGITKLAQEQLCLTLGRSYDIPVVVLRFFNVYGSRQSLSNPYTGILATFLARIRSGKQVPIYEDGEQQRDFVHVRDVVKACILAATRDEADYQVFNAGSGQPVSVLELARTLLRLYDDSARSRLQVTGQYRLGDIRDCYADIDKIESMLGYEPGVSLERGLREFIRWADSQSYVDLTDRAASELASAGLLGCAK